MQLPANDLEIVKTKPQSSEVFLSIFQPQTIMTCIPNGASPNAVGARTINYVTGSSSSGSYLSVEAGMTLLVGTTAGGRELGKIRIRSATSSTFIVAENSNIQWPLAQYFTVLRYWETWPIYPRIINDPGNIDNVIFYKDWDISYTNQNSVLGAFPCAGTHRAGFVGDSFYYSATGTYHLQGSALTYDWAFEGGSVTGSTSSVPGYVTYNTPGHYVTRLIVTGANGSVDTTYRYVSIYNRPENSSQNNPVTKFSFSNLSGVKGAGGYTSDITITDSPINLHDGDVVVLFTDDYYGSTHQSFGGNSPNNGSIFHVGHIINDTIKYNYQTSSVNFQMGSVSEIMKLTEGFSVSIESSASPTKWFQLLDMDGRRAIYHYLKWHSTILFFNDFEFIGTDQKIQYFDSDRQSMFDAIDNYMRGTLLGTLCTDRQGKLYAEVGAWAYTNPTGSFPPVMTITDRDWMGEPTITERLTPPLSFLELGGVAYSGSTTGTFSALISNAPGETPNTRGNTERTQGLALSSQDQLNTLTGNQFANKNAIYPNIDLEMGGNYRNLDIAPQETVDINISTGSTTRNIAIHAPYLVDSMSWRYDSKNKIMIPKLGLISLVNGYTGTTVTIPDIPDGGGYGGFGGGFNFGGNGSAFPPFLSSLPSIGGVVGEWTSSDPVLWNANTVYGTNFDGESYNFGVANYSGVTGSMGPVSGITLAIRGVYLITIRYVFNTTSVATYNVRTRVHHNGVPAGLDCIEYYPPSSAGTPISVGYQVLNAGTIVGADIYVTGATVTSGAAYLTIQLIRPV